MKKITRLVLDHPSARAYTKDVSVSTKSAKSETARTRVSKGKLSLPRASEGAEIRRALKLGKAESYKIHRLLAEGRKEATQGK